MIRIETAAHFPGGVAADAAAGKLGNGRRVDINAATDIGAAVSRDFHLEQGRRGPVDVEAAARILARGTAAQPRRTAVAQHQPVERGGDRPVDVDDATQPRRIEIGGGRGRVAGREGAVPAALHGDVFVQREQLARPAGRVPVAARAGDAHRVARRRRIDRGLDGGIGRAVAFGHTALQRRLERGVFVAVAKVVGRQRDAGEQID